MTNNSIRKDNSGRIIYGIAGAVMLLIIGSAVFVSQKKEAANAPGKVNPAAALPSAAFPAGDPLAYGIPYGTNEAAPVLELWEDFQCPACKAAEGIAGDNIRGLAEAGKIRLVYRTVNFLDRNLGNDSSTRGAIAFACSADQGAIAAYHDQIFKNQPTNEGQGYTDLQFTAFAKTAGLSGEKLAAWQKCYDGRTYKDWIANSMDQFTKNKHTGTPTAVLAGKVIETAVLVDAAKLADAIANVTK